MNGFWNWVDRSWKALASVKITLVVFVLLLLLAIPGMLILQVNISNVDPGLEYDYNFWKFGQSIQLFTSYHSFWYVGLIILLAMNLIACSVERWPQMWKLATARPVRWAKETFERQPQELRHEWLVERSKGEVFEQVMAHLKKKRVKPVVLEDGPNSFQVFWQVGRWSRVANYLVHTSLLVIFAGAIISSMYGFEGAANIPAGGAVDSLLIFKEGKASGLKPAQGGLINEKLLGFRVEAETFDVHFYEDYPGRPKDFISKLNVIEDGKVVASKTIRVNDPLEYKNFVFYQASYGRLGDFDLKFRIVGKKDPANDQTSLKSRLGEVLAVDKFGVQLVPLMAAPDLQNLGPAVQLQEMKNGRPTGEPFWVLKEYPQFDYLRRKESPYAIVVDNVKERFFTGLQIGYDPGAPIYWLGCAGMLLGTFYALFVTHRKYYLHFENGQMRFAGTIHRLPSGFEKAVAKWAAELKRHSRAMKHQQSPQQKIDT